MTLDQPRSTGYGLCAARDHRIVGTLRVSRLFVLAVTIGLVSLGLRVMNIGTSFDIFVDETLYLNISESVAHNGGVELFGAPFFLHPPAAFYVMATYLKIFQPSGNMIERIYSLRQLNAFLGALTAVILFLMAAQTTGQLRWGFLAAILFIVDPYIVYMNGRVMLETSAVWWVVGGFWLLLGSITNDAKRPSLRRAAFIGVLFGLGILNKDMIVFITLVPVALLFLMNWALPRRFLVTVAAVAIAVYSICPLSVLSIGQMSLFFHEKFSGLNRILGSEQITGMNRNVGPSFVDKLRELVGLYAGTYLFLGLGAFALLYLLTSKQNKHRVIVVWAASAYALLAYSIFFGTLEDQFFYFLAIPVVVLVTSSTAHMLQSQHNLVPTLKQYAVRRRWWCRSYVVQSLPDSATTVTTGKHCLLKTLKRLTARGVLLMLVVIIWWNAARWSVVHSTPTNGYEQALTYLRTHAPVGSRVASSSQIGQFILADGIDGLNQNGPWGLWNEVRDLKQYQPDYVIISVNQLQWDHGNKALDLVQWLDHNAQRAFEFGPIEGSPTGKLIVYDLRTLNAETQLGH